jgi:O-antigen/teichoic acid export membrane protein
MLDFGGASFVLSLSGALGMRSQDLIVGRLLGVRETGLFSRASGLAGQMSMLVVAAINGVFYPAFARKRDAQENLREPYLHLISCNTGVQWAAALGLALSAEPLVQLLYGPNWAQVAPLLRWVALAEIFFIAIPLQMDIPILLGRIRTLIWVNLADTAMTIAILTGFCLWGLEAAAQSRIAAGAIWFVIYAVFVGRLMRLSPASLAWVYLRSAICALAAATPLLLAHNQGMVTAGMGFLPLAGLCFAGGVCWFVTLPLVQHPLWGEVRLGLAQLPARRSGRDRA